MRVFLIAAFLLTLLVTACGKSSVRYAAPPVPSGSPIGISVSRLEIREVSLPAYAQTEEIWRETESGGLEADKDTLWADDPMRGITQELSQHLSAISGAQVASEPWPFEDLPQARLIVRLDQMVAGLDGRFHLSGQYFVARMSGGRDHAGTFNVSAPIAPESGTLGIAEARAVAVRDLAREIASRGL